MLLNGQDVTDTPLDFRKGDIENLEVTLSTHVSSVTGAVTDDKSVPSSDYAVVIFSADRTRWAFPSRFCRTGTPGPGQPASKVSALPPDEYLAVALPVIRWRSLQWQNPALLERLRPLGTSFALQEGESKTLDLKLKKRP